VAGGSGLRGFRGPPFQDLFGGVATAAGELRAGNDILIGGTDIVVPAFWSAGQQMIGDALRVDGQVTAGNDLLVDGARTQDWMWGDVVEVSKGGSVKPGRDIFSLGRENGHDEIFDFQAGRDRIDLTRLACEGLHRLSDLRITTAEEGIGDPSRCRERHPAA
jgi:hypothetical protein